MERRKVLLAVYVETLESADVYLTSLKNYDEKYRGREGKAVYDWKMRKRRQGMKKEEAAALALLTAGAVYLMATSGMLDMFLKALAEAHKETPEKEKDNQL